MKTFTCDTRKMWSLERPCPMRKEDYFIFFIGFFSAFEFHFVGVWSVGEIFLLGYGLFNFAPSRAFSNVFFRRVFGLFSLYLLVLILTDAWHGTALPTSINECGNIALLLIELCVGYLLFTQHPLRFMYYFLGRSISAISALYLFPREYTGMGDRRIQVDELGVVFAAISVFSGIYFYLYYKGFRKTAVAIGLGAATLALGGGSRALFLIFLFSIVFSLFAPKDSLDAYKEKVKGVSARFIVVLIFLVAMLFTGKQVYEYAAEGGYLGEEWQKKYLLQKESDLGLAGSSRMGFFIGTYAFFEEYWLIGSGSRAEDETDIFIRFASFANIYDSDLLRRLSQSSSLTVIHSCIMTSGVQAGFLGILVWIYLLYLCFKFLKNGWLLYPKLVAMSSFVIISFVWTVFFSPLGGRLSMVAPVLLLICYSSKIETLKKTKNQSL